MAFEGKTFDSIDLADLEALVENQVAEQRTLEYKRELPQQWTADATKEFLADVSSFANAGGGYILYGVQEAKDKKGVPEKLSGLSGVSADAEILCLESKIRTGVAPRIPGVRSKTIDLGDNRFILVLYIPRSWQGPHMLTGGESRFHSRTSNGKSPLDVHEIRDAFAAADSATSRINEFRLERVSAVVSQQTPVPLTETATVLLHSIPTGALSRGAASFDLSSPETARAFQDVKALYGSIHEQWHNFDGKIGIGIAETQNRFKSYVQAYRTGIVETVSTGLLEPRGDAKLIVHTLLEKHIIVTATSIMRFQQKLSLDPPVALMLSLARVAGYRLLIESPVFDATHGTPIDRDMLIVPEVLEESLDVIEEHSVARLLRPVFDMIWNAAGHPRSRNYDDNGEWKHGFWT